MDRIDNPINAIGRYLILANRLIPVCIFVRSNIRISWGIGYTIWPVVVNRDLCLDRLNSRSHQTMPRSPPNGRI